MYIYICIYIFIYIHESVHCDTPRARGDTSQFPAIQRVPLVKYFWLD